MRFGSASTPPIQPNPKRVMGLLFPRRSAPPPEPAALADGPISSGLFMLLHALRVGFDSLYSANPKRVMGLLFPRRSAPPPEPAALADGPISSGLFMLLHALRVGFDSLYSANPKRVMGVEPTTSSLGSLHSTAELHPL